MPSTSMRTRLPARDESLVQLGVRSDQWDYLVALAGNPHRARASARAGLMSGGGSIGLPVSR